MRASAVEADAAATRAEAALQERIEAARAERADSPVDTGPELTADEEEILLAACGQTCVDQWRAAKAATAQDVMDWVKANGGQIILDVVGYNDAKACFTKGEALVVQLGADREEVNRLYDRLQGDHKTPRVFTLTARELHVVHAALTAIAPMFLSNRGFSEEGFYNRTSFFRENFDAMASSIVTAVSEATVP